MNIFIKIGRVIALILAVLLSVYIVLFLFAKVASKPLPKHPWFKQKAGDHTPLVLAHQGGEGEYPSNTKLAFTKAVESGADVLDTDVFMTNDGHFVLFHDETLDHRTNGYGKISDKSLEELQKVDFAYYWSQDGGKTFPHRNSGISVYTLDELLNDFKEKRINIEMKQINSDTVKKFCTYIKERNLNDTLLVGSFSQPNMDTFRQECPNVATSATEKEVKNFYILSRLNLVGLKTPDYNVLQVPDKSGNFQIMSASFVSKAKEWGLEVYNWTIDTPDQDIYFTGLGSNGINTSYPKRIIDARK